MTEFAIVYKTVTADELETYDQCQFNTLFPSEEEATKHMNEAHGGYYRSSYKVVEANWRMRESVRFYNGTYCHPVWIEEDFWNDGYDKIRSHYVHVSVNNPKLLAYTPDEAKGEADRQIQMKPGKYLQQFFGDVLTQKQITFYAEWWAKGERPVSLDIDGSDLLFAQTPDEIVEVYAEGPSSCMHGSDCVAVYGAGDLAVAYLKRKEDDKIIARALCWPEKKTFGRVYPNTDSWEDDGFESEFESESAYGTLFQQLRARGFTSIQERSDVFDGARLLVRESENEGRGYFRMPYLDNCYRFDGPNAEGFFELRLGGKWSSNDTNGYAYVNTPSVCIHCGSSHDRRESLRAYWFNPKIGGWDYQRDEDGNRVSFCPGCKGEHVFECYQNHRWISLAKDTRGKLNGHEVSGNWLTYQLENQPRDYWQSDYSGEHHSAFMDPVLMANGQKWSNNEFRLHGFTCYVTGERYPLSELVRAPDGSPWSTAAVEAQKSVPEPLLPSGRWLNRPYSFSDESSYREHRSLANFKTTSDAWLQNPPFPTLTLEPQQEV